MQRHSKQTQTHQYHFNFTPFKAECWFLHKCLRFHFKHPFTCMVAGMTVSGKTFWVQLLLQLTGLKHDKPTTQEDCLVLFTIAAHVHANASHNTTTRFLFRCQQMALHRLRWSNDWHRQRQVNSKHFYTRFSSPQPKCHLYCTESISSGEGKPKHQLKQAMLGLFQEPETSRKLRL